MREQKEMSPVLLLFEMLKFYFILVSPNIVVVILKFVKYLHKEEDPREHRTPHAPFAQRQPINESKITFS